MTSFTPPPLPPGNTPARGIPPHKLILGVILAGSILFCCLMLLAGGVALLREAAPHGHAGLMRILVAARHAFAHHILHHK